MNLESPGLVLIQLNWVNQIKTHIPHKTCGNRQRPWGGNKT